MKFFASKKILITGASQGLGKALAIELSLRGADLCLISRNSERLSLLCEMLREKSVGADYIVCDVSDRNQMLDAAGTAIKRYGIIDIVILNAGIGGGSKLENIQHEKIRKIFDTNVFGLVNGLEAFIPVMLRQGFGTIAGVGSLAEPRGIPGNCFYGASKISVSHILEAARVELKTKNIKIISIKPGFIDTEMTSGNTFKMPFLLSPEKAAKLIADAMEKGKVRISFPLPTTFVSYLGKIVPGLIYENLIGLWDKSLTNSKN